MDEAPAYKKKWSLTDLTLKKLLALFDADPDIAAVRYEEMRLRLRKFFEYRRVKDPDALVDETFDRAARKIDEGVEILDIVGYLIGIAKFVLKEHQASPDSKMQEIRHDIDDIDRQITYSVEEGEDDVEQQLECLKSCSAKLTPRQRQQIIDYYSGEGREKINNRIRLAREEGVTLINLRVRMRRLRERLEKCILECLEDKK